jgi:heme/copper-type cytochrome/quinol oxidase subunit 1
MKMSKEDMAWFAFWTLVIALIIGITFLLKSVACESKFSQYGVTDYGPIQGCMITKPDGKRIPAETIREF